MWFCYILRNTNPKYLNLTYNGSTNDPIRRLRQHNEEIVGGAKATHGKEQSWEIYALLSGFENHVNALSCEWRIKHPSGKPGQREPKYRGVLGRIKSLNEVLPLQKWTKQCVIDNNNCKFKLHIASDVAHCLDRTIIPENIEVIVVDKITKEHMEMNIDKY
jgi:structure-specific endonuclease subunit SLX1